MCNMNNRRRKKRETEEIFEAIMADNFSQVNVRHQITDPRNSENTKQNKCSKIIPGNIIFKL